MCYIVKLEFNTYLYLILDIDLMRNLTCLKVAILIFFLSMTACNGGKEDALTDEQKYEVDSLIYANKNIDSLTVLIEKFIQNDNVYGQVIAHKEMGKIYRRSGDYAKSIEHHKEEIKKAQEIGDTIEIVQGLNNIGTNFRRMGILDEAASFHYKALEYCENFSDKESKKAKKNRVISLNGIGNIYLTLDNREAADSVLRLALQGEKELKSYVGQAINYANIGSLFESDNNLDSAYYYYSRSMECNEKANNKLGRSLCHTYFGRLYEKNHEWNKAIDEYKKAYDLMHDDRDKWHWIESSMAMANVYIKKKDLNSARKYLNEAEVTSKVLNSLEHMAEVERLKYLWNLQQGNSSKALECYIQSRNYADSVTNENNLSHIQNLRIKYERDRSQSEINLLQENYEMEKNNKNMFMIIFLIIIAFSLLIIAFLWYILRMREKNQKMLQNLEKMRTNFFTNITHEFRTPLTVILGFSKQLEKGELEDGNTMENVGMMISRQGRNLLNLINQLLDISKIKSAIGMPDWRNGDVVPYIRMICDSYQQTAKHKRIDLLYSSEMTSIDMDFIPDYMHKVMRNLLSNAVKFTPEYGRVYITTSVEGDNLKLVVSDTGKGISLDELPHIFDAFYQCDNSRTEIGTGIGLSLVKQVIEAMNGKITVKSTLGKGSVFIIVLPLRHGKSHFKALEPDVFASENSVAIESADEVKLPGGKAENDTVPIALIVEDNADVSYYIGTQLQSNYNLYYARNGEEGLEKANELMPDIIITDLMMPEMDGLELCRRVRASEILNHIPIIVITAKSTEADRIKGIEAGADAYLYKPFNSEELNVRVRNLLDLRRMMRSKYSKALQEGVEETVELSAADQDFLNKLVDITYSRMSSCNIDIEQIASAMCMSSKQLNRKLLAITGENSTSYIIQIRLSKAKRLLDSPDNIPIGEIAMQCGFEDSAYFSRIFKKMFNLTPSQYRKRVK